MEAASGTPVSACLSLSARSARSAAGTADWSTTTVSGPFAPGPKAVEMRSYARRSVNDLGSAPSPMWPSWMKSSGNARTSSTRTPPVRNHQGRLSTRCA